MKVKAIVYCENCNIELDKKYEDEENTFYKCSKCSSSAVLTKIKSNKTWKIKR